MFIKRKEKKELKSLRGDIENLQTVMWETLFGCDVDEWRKTTSVCHQKQLQVANQKLELLLDHLNLKYIPESTETKAARLEIKKSSCDFNIYPCNTIWDRDTTYTDKLESSHWRVPNGEKWAEEKPKKPTKKTKK